MKTKLTLSVLAIAGLSCYYTAQQSNEQILRELQNEITRVDKNPKLLLTRPGFNMLIQKKTLSYLTGTSDLSLSKFYAAYGTESDRLNLGFNIPVYNPDSRRLILLINPIFEADFKNGFSTLYKSEKWQNNIRGGVKLTYLIPMSTINFLPSKSGDYKIARTKKFKEIKEGFDKDSLSRTQSVHLISGEIVRSSAEPLTKREWKKRRNEALEQLGMAEAAITDKRNSYTWMQTAWISAWIFFPLSEAEKYIASDNSQVFQNAKFNLWELNLQATYLLDFKRCGTFYFTPWIKYFQNNSANADLMTSVDYVQYEHFPGASPQNLAILETNKAYIGAYDEFMTTNLNLQFVYMTPFTNAVVKPGFSFRYEKNWGDYNPTNLRIGLPLVIQGKGGTPINIELQYRINDLNNYKSVVNHSPKEIFGISVAIPIVPLYK